MRSVEIDLPDEGATAALARRIGTVLRPGDTLLLSGPVGAGKSHFARALIQDRLARVGAPVEDVPSPSFTLVQTYEAGAVALWHADLYRLAAPDELLELGLFEALADAITLIEWPERLGPERPDRHLAIALDLAGPVRPDARRVRITAAGPGWERVIGAAMRAEGAAA
ncbi:MAG: tRNA (adenosine(37)-N6)-threonylcarbamoyltransferase complex ATPase subunit type 1 TsaE [Pseudomonadota bacterium]